MEQVIKYYRAYLDRNETFERFTSDVNTLGGTFNEGYIETTKEKVTVKDRKWQVIYIMPLKEVWRLGKVNQMSLI